MVPFLVSSVSCRHTYYGNPQINLTVNEHKELSVTIDTDRLHIRSVEPTEAEYDRYATLYGNEEAMEKFGTGEIQTREEMINRINDIWVKCWRENDPYAGFTVFKRNTNTFLGHIALDETIAGEAELSYLFHRPYWGKGYGSEASLAIVKEYAPITVREGYAIKGKPLERIVATARPDNPASCRILKKVGMQFIHAEERFGALRNHYSMDVSELKRSNFQFLSRDAVVEVGKVVNFSPPIVTVLE